MASTLATDKFSSTHYMRMYRLDPDVDTAVEAARLDLSPFDWFAVGYVKSIGTGNLDTFTLNAHDAASGGTPVVVKTNTADPDAEDDFCFLELTKEELASLGTNLRWVSATIELATATDEATIVYVAGSARWPRAGLTANVIA